MNPILADIVDDEGDGKGGSMFCTAVHDKEM
jgi:hypothetical protein